LEEGFDRVIDANLSIVSYIETVFLPKLQVIENSAIFGPDRSIEIKAMIMSARDRASDVAVEIALDSFTASGSTTKFKFHILRNLERLSGMLSTITVSSGSFNGSSISTPMETHAHADQAVSQNIFENLLAIKTQDEL